MTEPEAEITEKIDVNAGSPVALLLCADLMFAVQIQNIARSEGFRIVTLRPGAAVPGDVAVLVVNLADLGRAPAWQGPVEAASAQGVPVIAFGPHVDGDSRRAAKVAGASRVLANSNLTRDLPVILRDLRPDRAQENYSTKRDAATSTPLSSQPSPQPGENNA